MFLTALVFWMYAKFKHLCSFKKAHYTGLNITMEISQNDTLLNKSKTKNLQYWENQGYQIQNWNVI